MSRGYDIHERRGVTPLNFFGKFSRPMKERFGRLLVRSRRETPRSAAERLCLTRGGLYYTDGARSKHAIHGGISQAI